MPAENTSVGDVGGTTNTGGIAGIQDIGDIGDGAETVVKLNVYRRIYKHVKDFLKEFRGTIFTFFLTIAACYVLVEYQEKHGSKTLLSYIKDWEEFEKDIDQSATTRLIIGAVLVFGMAITLYVRRHRETRAYLRVTILEIKKRFFDVLFLAIYNNIKAIDRQEAVAANLETVSRFQKFLRCREKLKFDLDKIRAISPKRESLNQEAVQDFSVNHESGMNEFSYSDEPAEQYPIYEQTNQTISEYIPDELSPIRRPARRRSPDRTHRIYTAGVQLHELTPIQLQQLQRASSPKEKKKSPRTGTPPKNQQEDVQRRSQGNDLSPRQKHSPKDTCEPRVSPVQPRKRCVSFNLTTHEVTAEEIARRADRSWHAATAVDKSKLAGRLGSPRKSILRNANSPKHNYTTPDVASRAQKKSQLDVPESSHIPRRKSLPSESPTWRYTPRSSVANQYRPTGIPRVSSKRRPPTGAARLSGGSEASTVNQSKSVSKLAPTSLALAASDKGFKTKLPTISKRQQKNTSDQMADETNATNLPQLKLSYTKIQKVDDIDISQDPPPFEDNQSDEHH